MTQKVDVIGGSGFIGTRLINRLSKYEKFILNIVDKAPSKKFPLLTSIGDVRSCNDLENCITRDSIIVNLAAEHRDDVRPLSLYDEVNIGGAQNICTVAEKKGTKTIIFTSSVAVYGFAPVGTDETGKINPFNDYGRTKYEAEKIFRAWQEKKPTERTLVIIRPTVVFGEGNRGNVYNLLRQIALKRFVMVGHGHNRKSMAYVENIAAFIEQSLSFAPGIHLYNFIDKPDFTMNRLVETVNLILGRNRRIGLRIPYAIGHFLGACFDCIAAISGKRFPISAIRVKKFCSDSVYNTAIGKTGFTSPVPLNKAIENTILYEFSKEKQGS